MSVACSPARWAVSNHEQCMNVDKINANRGRNPSVDLHFEWTRVPGVATCDWLRVDNLITPSIQSHLSFEALYVVEGVR
jgi:hypothetical protein